MAVLHALAQRFWPSHPDPDSWTDSNGSGLQTIRQQKIFKCKRTLNSQTFVYKCLAVSSLFSGYNIYRAWATASTAATAGVATAAGAASAPVALSVGFNTVVLICTVGMAYSQWSEIQRGEAVLAQLEAQKDGDSSAHRGRHPEE